MHMHFVPRALRTTVAAAALAAAALAQAPLTFGNLFVVRIGDGVAALSNAATATFVDEYTPTGTLVQSIAMPTAVSGLNQPLTNSGTATSEGFLNLSSNGIYLTLGGYSAVPGTAAISATTSLLTPRVIGRIDLLGGVDTSTTITDGYSAGNLRAVVSTDGNQFWTSGTAAANAGIRYALLGGSTTVGLNLGAPNNTRVVGIYDNRLFTSSSSTGFYGICQVGSGIPTTAGQPITLQPGFPSTVGPSSYDYYFASPTTLYVADDRAIVSNGGIQKWSLVGGAWTLQYTLVPPTTLGCRGLTGWTQNGVTTLWATTGATLVTVVDAGVGSAVTTLVTAPPNQALRGVRYLGKPSTLARLPGGCGTADISTVGNAEIGTDVTTTILNPVGIPFIGYGVTPLGFPLPGCSCLALHEFLVLNQASQFTLSVPNTPSIVGVLILTQGMDLLGPATCLNLAVPLALTDGYSFTIQ